MLSFNGFRPGGLLREPMLHFLLAGSAILTVFAMLQEPEQSADVIVLTDAELDAVVEQFRQTWRTDPDEAEIAALVEQLVREEVLYREALAMGLDQGDTVIRQRLRQKLEFIVAASQEVAPPSQAELLTWFETHRDRYAPLPTLQFDQVMIENAANVGQLRAALSNGANPKLIGKATQLPVSIDAVTAAVDAGFGPGFSDAVAALPVGVWSGPVASSYGQHLVRVISITREEPEFLALRDAVESDWLRNATQQRMEAVYAEMRAAYEIRLPGGPNE